MRACVVSEVPGFLLVCGQMYGQILACGALTDCEVKIRKGLVVCLLITPAGQDAKVPPAQSGLYSLNVDWMRTYECVTWSASLVLVYCVLSMWDRREGCRSAREHVMR